MQPIHKVSILIKLYSLTGILSSKCNNDVKETPDYFRPFALIKK